MVESDEISRFEKLGIPVPLLKDDGTCPKCHNVNCLLIEIDEEGVCGILCKNCGWQKRLE